MRLLVPIDFSTGAATVLAETRKWASLFAADVWLIHVVATDPRLVDAELAGMSTPSQRVRDHLARQFREEHKQLQQEATELRKAGVSATPLLVQGPVAATILKEADKLKADMIIVGSHGHGTIYDLLVGSTSEGILRKAKCPVLVVPTHKRP